MARLRRTSIVDGSLALAMAFAVASRAAAQSNPDQRPSSSAVVSSITVKRENVFDAAEQTRLARIANKLHIVTRERIVTRELLMAEGAPYDSAVFAETARNLRKLGIFRDVSVDSVTSDSGLAAQVTTHDSWSTQVYVSFKSSGDQISWGVGLNEKNLLGQHIKASIRYTDDPDRSSTEFSLGMPRVVRNRLGVDMSYKELSDGKSGKFVVSAPFTALTTPQSFSVDLRYDDGDVLQFFEGEPEARDTLRHLMGKATTTAGWATKASSRGFVRYNSTLQLRREDFVQGPIDSEDRSFFGELEVSVEQSQSEFAVIRGYRNMVASEDVDLSRTIRVGLWVAPSAWGYERTGFGPSLWAQAGKAFTKGFATAELRGSALFTHTGVDSGSVAAKATVALQPGPRHSIVFNANAGLQKNPYPGEEFDLGLTFGPRGYPAHAFTGDRAFFTTAEYRWVAVPNLFSLLSIGLAAVADYGGAWYKGSPTRTGADAGVGLRFGSVRSSSGKPAGRVDLVRRFAADGFDDEWVLAVGTGFPFDRIK